MGKNHWTAVSNVPIATYNCVDILHENDEVKDFHLNLCKSMLVSFYIANPHHRSTTIQKHIMYELSQFHDFPIQLSELLPDALKCYI